MFKKPIVAVLILMMCLSATFVSYGIDLNSIRNDSKVVTDLLARTVKEATALAIKSKDVKMSMVTLGEKGDQYKGLQIAHAVDGDVMQILFGVNNQRRNLKTSYETMTPQKGLLYKSYTGIVGTVLGKDYSTKHMMEAYTYLEKMRTNPEIDATSSATSRPAVSATDYPEAVLFERVLNDKLDTVMTGENKIYNAYKIETCSSTNVLDSTKKIKAGIGNVVIAIDNKIASKRDYVQFIKGLYEGLVKVLTDTKVEFESNYNDRFTLNLSDKITGAPVGGISVNVTTGEVKVSAGADKGLTFFKSVTDVVLKQVDPSGKTTFDKTFKTQMNLLKEYEKFDAKLGLKETYQYVNEKGQVIDVANDQQFFSKLMPSFKVTSPVVQKEGATALKIKVSLFDGYLFVKEGSYHLLIDLY